MRNIISALFVVSLLVSNSFGASLPFYFPAGVIQTKDPVKQMQEYVRYMAATTYKFQGNKHNPYQRLIPGSDSIVIQTDIDSTTRIAADGKVEKCRIVLDHFVRMPDGKIRVTQLADQFYISETELKVVVEDLTNLVTEASQNDYEYWKDLSDLALRARATKIFSKPAPLGTASVLPSIDSTSVLKFKKMLDEKDPQYGITLRELHYLPKDVKPSDFVPRELHLGYTPEIEGIFGVCWLNTGIVYYNPMARILDYLTGKPKVLQHEMVHCNYNLEKFPLASGFDSEFFAMFPEVFFDENKIDFFFHHYCTDLREFSEIYFGFDFDEARKQIFRYDLAGAVIIDEKKFREYSEKLDRVRVELSRAIREQIIPEYYSDPLFWSSMHDKLGDKNGIFWIMMAKLYKPTILGNARESAIWTAAHDEEIMEMAGEAYKNSGEGGGVHLMVGGQNISASLLNELGNFLAPEERNKVESYFTNHPEIIKEISTMSIGEAISFIKRISHEGGMMQYER